eukprot:TRINITY_DN2765_c0_g1_i3.p1 TRINITY_DN2765_c0_g1~~TRINITY_DN2765_c0_g1_i3.p1  ORF type:complete len:168 (-),score=28.00 TRINITY_DN2765_c0_g1_i3:526-1029(-)
MSIVVGAVGRETVGRFSGGNNFFFADDFLGFVFLWGDAVGALRQLFYVAGVTPGTIGIVAALALYDQDFIFMAFLTVVCVWINSYHGQGRKRQGRNPLSFGKYTGPYIVVLVIQFMFSFVSNMIIITPGEGTGDEWRAIFLFFNNVYGGEEGGKGKEGRGKGRMGWD